MKRSTSLSAVAALSLLAGGLASGSSAGALPAADRSGAAFAAADRAVRAHPGALHASAADALRRRGQAVLDGNGASHVRYERAHRGLPVLGGDAVVHLDAAGSLRGVSQTLHRPLDVATTPTATTAEAVRAARAVFAGQVGTAIGRLVVDATGASARLAYDVLVTGERTDGTPSRLHVIVDARTGRVLRSHDEVQTGSGNSIYSGTVTIGTSPLSTGGYQMIDNGRGGNYATDVNNQGNPNTGVGPDGTVFTDADDVWGNGTNTNRQSAGVDALYGANTTYDFYKNVLGRNGIFGDGRGVRSRVHFATNYSNAFWDGTQMTYGDGASNARPLVSLDIAGHEMTHGVTENTANLTYSGESGGLNEATSDIIGTAVEFAAANSADAGDYLVGEKVDINGNGTPLRYMDRPSRDGASADCWSSGVGSLNVHYSSGPANHAYYLMSEGSGAKTINGVSYNSPTCNSSTVTPIGRDAATRIWYRALSVYMTSSTNYSGARTAAVNAARDLYGATSAQCAGVASAFSAINVSGTMCSTTPPPPPTGNLISNPGFESGASGWSATSGVVTSDSTRARTGTWLGWLNGYGRAHTDTLSQTVAIPAASRATLTFWLKVTSAERSTTAADDRLAVQVVNGTTTTTLATYSNLNKGTSYVQRTLNLTAYAGRTVTIKLTGTEDSSAATNFFTDDFSLTTG